MLQGHRSRPGQTRPPVLLDQLWRSSLDLFSHGPPSWVPQTLDFLSFFFYGAVSCASFTRIRAHLRIPQPQLCFLFMSIQLMVQKRCCKAGHLLVLYLIKKLKESLSNASMQAGCLKAQLLFSSHIRGPENQPSTVSRWPQCRIGVHVGSSSQWDKCWPLALDVTPLFQGLGAETDVGKLPHVNKRERGPPVKGLCFLCHLVVYVNLRKEGGTNWERSGYGVQIAVDALNSTKDIIEDMEGSGKGF